MVNLDLLKKSIPVAPIKIAALPGCEELANTVNGKNDSSVCRLFRRFLSHRM